MPDKTYPVTRSDAEWRSIPTPEQSDVETVVVADTSVVINLNASGRAGGILAALPFRVVVTDIVASEVQDDRRSGRQDAALLKALTDADRLRIVSPGNIAPEIFADLVIGSAIDTFDDGEAATIVFATELGIAPVLEERKALRIYAARFQGPPALSTVDLFATTPVGAALGRAGLRDAVFQTLQTARMRVPAERIPWVLDLIGPDRAAQCPRLPKAARGA